MKCIISVMFQGRSTEDIDWVRFYNPQKDSTSNFRRAVIEALDVFLDPIFTNPHPTGRIQIAQEKAEEARRKVARKE